MTYGRPQDLLKDYEQQFQRGGLLVCVDAAGLNPGDAISLELALSATRMSLTGTVIQILAGSGVAVGFNANDDDLANFIDAARRLGDAHGEAPRHERIAVNRPRKPLDARGKVEAATTAEKMQIALRGSRDERALILRDTNKTLHQYVVRNPRIGADEVAFIARMTTAAPDLLKFIAGRREWAQRTEIAAALVRNPKTPTPIAIRMIDHISAAELRQLAKTAGVRAPIQRAARKRLLKR